VLLALGGVTLLVLVIGVVAVLRLAKTQRAQSDEDETPPPSSDFVAPVSSGAFRFRKAEESAAGFHDRINKESEEITSSRPGAKS
jgi:flagellar biosynthesis/type III secretory pathway M-ring protein FliF/YscJ